MRNAPGVCVGVVVSALFGAAASGAVVTDITDNNVASLSDVTTDLGLVSLDLTSVVSGITLTTNNSVTTSFSSGTFDGLFTASVFANQGSPGSGVNQVALVYEFEITSGTDPVDRFLFGRDGQANLDKQDLIGATQGTIADLTSAGQASADVDYLDNSGVGSNDNLRFEFQGVGDQLVAGERFGWYQLFDGGDIAVDVIQVQAIDVFDANFLSLGVVLEGTQPDLNVPAPGSLAALLAAGGIVARRRRR